MIVASIFQVLIVKPIFNLLVLVYALIPGHNFGLAIIIFTIAVRLLMWPLVKKQLHHAKITRSLQPELKKIKAAAKGDRQKEQSMMMELYKERGISPFGSIGIIIVQFIILIGLYSGLQRVVHDPHALVSDAYSWIGNLSWMQGLRADIHLFDGTLFNWVDLTKAAVPKGGGPIYIPALLLVIGSAAIQYMTSKQLLPKSKDSRSLRQIFKEAGSGTGSDQTEVNVAVSRTMVYLIPGMIFLFTINLPAALGLYWLVGGIVAYIQQGRVLGDDEEEMEALAEDKDGEVIEGEIIESPKKSRATPSAKKAKSASKKRRK